VGRLMLEPPTRTPREVEATIHADEARTAKDTARAGIWAVFATLAFTPLLWWIAPAWSPHVLAFTGMLAVVGLMCVHATRSTTPRPGLVVIANTVLVIFTARMFSPVLIAPGVAAVLAFAMVLTPRFSILGSASMIAAMLSGAILVPWLLERLQILSITMSVDDHGILFQAPAIAGAEFPTIIVGGLYTIGLVIGACAMANAMRTRAKEAARHLHLQAWQLRQLVPTA
ncbi:MAG: hypothetical protein NT062_21550, partial [Proteobacteria bacterium]|nr:hypothetical protein [Pseudomonadota bacterium]